MVLLSLFDLCYSLGMECFNALGMRDPLEKTERDEAFYMPAYFEDHEDFQDDDDDDDENETIH